MTIGINVVKKLGAYNGNDICFPCDGEKCPLRDNIYGFTYYDDKGEIQGNFIRHKDVNKFIDAFPEIKRFFVLSQTHVNLLKLVKDDEKFKMSIEYDDIKGYLKGYIQALWDYSNVNYDKSVYCHIGTTDEGEVIGFIYLDIDY